MAAAAAAEAAERARVRSDNAALVAVGRLRAPQSVFNPLHRTPSRPEMRRSVTHGRFSPAGRKLWRQSEGLSPRTGQLCLSPRRRGQRSGGDGPAAADWAELWPAALATHQEESRWGFADAAEDNPSSKTGAEDNSHRPDGRSDGVADGSPSPSGGHSMEDGRREEEEEKEEDEEEEEDEARGNQEEAEVDPGLPDLDELDGIGWFEAGGVMLEAGEGSEAVAVTAAAASAAVESEAEAVAVAAADAAAVEVAVAVATAAQANVEANTEAAVEAAAQAEAATTTTAAAVVAEAEAEVEAAAAAEGAEATEATEAAEAAEATEVEGRSESNGVPAAARGNCDKLEEGYGSDCDTAARGDPDPPPVATRCHSYIVKLPWDGQK